MWVIWALMICGGVFWDAADCIRLQNSEGTFCAEAARTTAYYTIAKCKAVGDDAQTWLWDGKRLKNKLTGRCFGIWAVTNKALETCKYVSTGYESSKQAGIEDHRNRTELTRFGKHGLKASNGECVKMFGLPLPGRIPQMRFSDCEEDKNDPYYE
jgi:hypothetical protein